MRSIPYQKEYDAIKEWIDLPTDGKPDLPPKLAEMWKRWNMADDMLREHWVERKAIERLIDKFGYSKTSAERDIRMAKKLWGFVRPEEKEYLKRMLIDYGTESMVRAGKDRQFGAVARLMKEIRETAGIGKPNEELPDETALGQLVLIEPVFDPGIVGADPMTDTERTDLFKRLMASKRSSGFIEMSIPAEDAEPTDGAGN